MRLYNFLKNTLGLTKQELIEYLKHHEVKVNDLILPSSTILKDSDIVFIDGKKIDPIPMKYYLYYKPRGILSTVSNLENSYINHIRLPYKVTPAGRLDKESEGLMILSNDGKFLNEIAGDSFLHEKEYIVVVNKRIDDEFIMNMQKSYLMDGRMTKPAKVKKLDDYTFNIILYEGLYHQIRRLVKISNNSVKELKRIRIANYYLSNMAPGDLIEFKK